MSRRTAPSERVRDVLLPRRARPSHTSTSHGHDEPDPASDRVDGTSWSANLEKLEHADDREFLLERAVDYEYVEQCGCGGHVTRARVPG